MLLIIIISKKFSVKREMLFQAATLNKENFKQKTKWQQTKNY